MKNNFLFVWLLVVCSACSTDSVLEEIPEPVQEFDVTLMSSVNEVFVDVPFTVKVQGTEGIQEISRVVENRSESITSLMPNTPLEEKQLHLNLDFGFLGNEDVVLKFTSITGKVITKTLNFEVKRGNAVKIVGFKINSFYNMDGSWDEGFSETDVTRLADVRFGLRKLRQGHMSSSDPTLSSWYLSPVYPNTQHLDWDLSQEELYISESSILDFGIADVDEDGTAQDLTMGFREVIRLNDYRETKPTEIRVANEEYGLDVTIRLEWL